MSKLHLIRDIRYYQSITPDVDFQPLPGDKECLFAFPRSIHAIGQRIARKLQEHGFITGSFHHIYVNFTNVLPHEEISLSNRCVENLIKYINLGIDPKRVSGMSNDELESFIIECTFRALSLIARNEQQTALLAQTKKEIKEAGDSLEIHFKTRETTKYKVVITYQINERPNSSPVYISYYDKVANKSGKCLLTQLELYDDIHWIVGQIVLKGEELVIRPLTSATAKIYLKRYNTPLKLSIKDILTS